MTQNSEQSHGQKGIKKLPMLCLHVHRHVSREAERGLLASSVNAPDLGGEAGRELLMTDGSSNLEYRSDTETK